MRHHAPLLIVALLLACGERGPAEATPDGALPHVTLVRDIGIGGGLDASEEYEFGRISGVAVADDGSVAVLDALANTIRVYSEEGRYRYTIGRSGAGPGELARACCLAFDSDGQLWVRDGGNSRYSSYRLSAGGAHYVGQRRMAHGDVNRWAPVTFDAARHLIDVGARSDPSTGAMRNYRFHLAPDGAVTREVALHPVPPDSTGMKSVQRQLPGGYATMFSYPPHAPTELVAHAPTGEYAHAVSSAYAIDWRDADGALRHRVTFPLESGPALDADERARAEQHIEREAERLGVARTHLGFGVPAAKQPLRGLFFDEQGRLWVELSVRAGADRRAHVYGTDGTLRHEVAWPAGVDIRSGVVSPRGIWGISRDSLDVESLVRLRGDVRW